jgi:hypothetical protein
MARGWESKNIESQQEEAMRRPRKGPPPTADDLARAERRHSLGLMRSRAADDLGRASAPAHRRMLEEAIADLDRQIAALGA